MRSLTAALKPHMESKRLVHTAYHEAGHATILLIYKETFEDISISSQGRLLGGVSGVWLHTIINMMSIGPGSDIPEVDVAIKLDLAGYAASELNTQRSYGINKRSPDYQTAFGIAQRITWDDDEAEGILESQWQATLELLREHWPVVEAIARQLLQTTRMTYAEAQSIYCQFLEEKQQCAESQT